MTTMARWELLTRLRWHVRMIAASEARFAIAAACCLLAAAGCLGIALLERQAGGVLEVELAGRRADLRQQMAVQPLPAARQELGALLPDVSRSAELLQQLFDVAEQTGIKLNEGDYRLRATSDPQVTQLSISMPLTADYQHVQRFLASALYQIPNLGLDSLQLQREKPDQAELDAKLLVVLYFSSKKRGE